MWLHLAVGWARLSWRFQDGHCVGCLLEHTGPPPHGLSSKDHQMVYHSLQQTEQPGLFLVVLQSYKG